VQRVQDGRNRPIHSGQLGDADGVRASDIDHAVEDSDAGGSLSLLAGQPAGMEVAMFRYKKVIGRGLHARTLPTRKTEAKVACKVINTMTGLGMPVSRWVA
jgi:hypothetical protein